MQNKVKKTGDVTVVTLKGKLMGGNETDACHAQVKDLLQAGDRKIVVDLSHVKWMNSKGLGMLMACFTSIKGAGGDLKIAGATDKVNSLFVITKLMTVFDTCSSVDEAVKSF